MPRPYRIANIDDGKLPQLLTLQVNRVAAREFVVSLAQARALVPELNATIAPIRPLLPDRQRKAGDAALDAMATVLQRMQAVATYLRSAINADDKRPNPSRNLTAWLPENVDVNFDLLLGVLDEAESDFTDAVQEALIGTTLEKPVDGIMRSWRAAERRLHALHSTLIQACAKMPTPAPRPTHFTLERKRA